MKVGPGCHLSRVLPIARLEALVPTAMSAQRFCRVCRGQPHHGFLATLRLEGVRYWCVAPCSASLRSGP